MAQGARSNVELEDHFEFGQNWAKYSQVVSESHLQFATSCLKRLLAVESLEGKTLFDVGCGSGIHSVAAALLGAEVTAVDLDPKCIATTRSMSERFDMENQIKTKVRSVFELDPAVDGTFDIVYSWGVLHHTGAMWDAIAAASSCVKPGGTLALAIYRRTKCCPMWKVEKSIYSRMPRVLQWPVRVMYVCGTEMVGIVKRQTSPLQSFREYKQSRGMSRWHDIHDWLGGYPYESARPGEIDAFLKTRHFDRVRGFVDEDDHVPWGFSGSGCAEYVFQRTSGVDDL